MGKGTSLAERQDEMRQRNSKQKQLEHENRPLCVAKCGRFARKNSPYCSRCSQETMMQSLRDTLPGENNEESIPIQTQLEVGVAEEEQFSEPDTLPPSPPLPPGTRTYTRAQAAKILGVSGTTLMRAERKGIIPQPTRLRHNNQCLYTDEMIEIYKKYMSETYVPDPVDPSTSRSISSNPFNRPLKGRVKTGKAAEKTVARRINLGGTLRGL